MPPPFLLHLIPELGLKLFRRLGRACGGYRRYSPVTWGHWREKMEEYPASKSCVLAAEAEMMGSNEGDSVAPLRCPWRRALLRER